MTLAYDSFGMRLFDVRLVIWPGFAEGFRPGQLSALYAALNDADQFDSSDLRGTVGARFDGESWSYDISPISLRLRSENFTSGELLATSVGAMLNSTRAFFQQGRGRQHERMIFGTMEINVVGVVPDSKHGNVGEILRKKILPKARADQRGATLPGLTGAGLKLVGDSDESDPPFHWHATVEPSHEGGYDELRLSAEIYPEPSADPPSQGEDVELVQANVLTAYEFLADHVKEFSESHFKG